MEPVTTRSLKTIEEISLNAWPCLQQILYDGWILRFAKGYTRRANSVNPIYAGVLDTATKIERCSRLYQDRQLTPVFKITPFAQPANLDDLLAEAGYQKQAPTGVQLLDLSNLPQNESTCQIQQSAIPTEQWLMDYTRMNQVSAKNTNTFGAILNNIAPKSCFTTLMNDQQTLACGLAVLDDGYVGLFDIVTEPMQRGKGYGAQLIFSLLHWAKANGAHTAYLQVMLENEPANRLYAKLGFKEVYQYWYRVFGEAG